MRTITSIGKGNESFFNPLFMGAPTGEGIVRLGVIENGRAAAALSAAVNDGRADLGWFYVDEELRRKGIGRFLLESFLEDAEDGGMTCVYACYPCNEALDALFADEGFLVMPGEPFCSLDTAEALATERVTAILNSNLNSNVRMLKDLGVMDRKELMQILNSEHLMKQDLDTLACDQELSAVVKEEAAGPEAVLLSDRQDNRYLLQYLYNDRSDEPDNLLQLIRYLAESIRDDPSFSELCFSPASSHIRKFTEKLVSDPSLIREQTLTSVATLAF